MTNGSKIAIVVPLKGMTAQSFEPRREFLLGLAAPGTEIGVYFVPDSPRDIESRFDKALVAPLVCRACVSAERDGYQGVMLWGGVDPAVPVARETVEIPVVGPFEASLAYANLLATSFSVLMPVGYRYFINEDTVREHGLEARCRSLRGIEMEPEETGDHPDVSMQRLYEQGRLARDEDGAHALVWGCLTLWDRIHELGPRLGIPVINPAMAAMFMLDSLIRMGQTFSHRTYPRISEADRQLAFDFYRTRGE